MSTTTTMHILYTIIRYLIGRLSIINATRNGPPTCPEKNMSALKLNQDRLSGIWIALSGGPRCVKEIKKHRIRTNSDNDQQIKLSCFGFTRRKTVVLIQKKNTAQKNKKLSSNTGIKSRNRSPTAVFETESTQVETK